MIGSKIEFQGTHCHKGIYTCAKSKFDSLQQILEKTFKVVYLTFWYWLVYNFSTGPPRLSLSSHGTFVGRWNSRLVLPPRQRRSHLFLMLSKYCINNFVVYPKVNLKCWAFACPAVLPLTDAVMCSSWLTSVVVRHAYPLILLHILLRMYIRDDVVPRLSFGSLIDLKERIKLILSENKGWGKKFAHFINGGRY